MNQWGELRQIDDVVFYRIGCIDVFGFSQHMDFHGLNL
jgi:hypothetical protein